MDNINSYYKILGLEPGASQEQVKQAYRDLVRVWHPDRYAHDSLLQEKVQEKLKEINDAYEKINNIHSSYAKESQEEKRKDYQSEQKSHDEPSQREPKSEESKPAERSSTFFKNSWIYLIPFIILLIILAVGLALYFTADMVGVVEKQLALLRQGDINGAYGLTSKDFQKATSLEKFTAFVKAYPSLSQNQGHTFTTRSIENSIGTVKGTLAAKDGAVTPVEFQLVKEQGEWRILFIKLRATGAATDNK